MYRRFIGKYRKSSKKHFYDCGIKFKGKTLPRDPKDSYEIASLDVKEPFKLLSKRPGNTFDQISSFS